jgi:hypothetical protein
MDWRCDSNGRAPALQAQSSEFKPMFCQRRRSWKSGLLYEIYTFQNVGNNFLKIAVFQPNKTRSDLDDLFLCHTQLKSVTPAESSAKTGWPSGIMAAYLVPD